MAYFGEALANAALLGAVLGVLLDVNMLLGVLALSLLLASLLAGLERGGRLPLDTLLSILAHGSLALGLLVLSLMDRLRVDLMGYLFGDVLAVSRADLGLIAATAAVVLAVLVTWWRPLLSATVHADLAAVEGVPVARMRLLLTLLLAGTIAVGMKVVGILLIVSLLVVPAAAARRLAGSPEAMAAWASAIGCLAVTAGLWLSFTLDVPAGPAVVVVAVTAFALASALDIARAR
jgi:zinc transport system permease protein